MKKKFTGILLAGCIALSACASNAENTSEAITSLETAASVETTTTEEATTTVPETTPLETEALSSAPEAPAAFPFTDSELFEQMQADMVLAYSQNKYYDPEDPLWEIGDTSEGNGYNITCIKLGTAYKDTRNTYVYCFTNQTSGKLEAIEMILEEIQDLSSGGSFYTAATTFLNSIGIKRAIVNLLNTDLSQDGIQISIKEEWNAAGDYERLYLTAVLENSDFQNEFFLTPPGASEPETTEAYNSPSITRGEFNSLKIGITYNEAVEIIGGYGELISESGTPGSRSHTVMYQWTGSGKYSGSATLVFQGGKLTSKSQYGLEY
ncbi:hypothetical protein [Hominifimenecus sp. rT4P-3]|uniref:hypothetical protein n=1 Tax=Hominifimenecus sp. rT4P-3 TaxID=3242979 RepID=UPI003DA3FEFF